MYTVHKSKAVTIVSIVCIVFGATVCLAWLFNLKGLESFFPDYVYMKFNTALCLILFGAACILIQAENLKYKKIIFYSLALMLFLIAAITLSEYIFHYNAGIDQLLIHDRLAGKFKTLFPGRMYPVIAFALLLYSLALFGFGNKNLIVINLSQYAFHIVTIIGAIAIVSYVYNVSFLNNLKSEGPMTLIGAFLLFSTSIVVTLLHPKAGITGLFNGNLIGNLMASRLFILIVVLIVFFGFIKSQDLGFKLFSFDTSFSLLTICLLLLCLAFIWHTAEWLNKIDRNRVESEQSIKGLNEELEHRVAERTQELMETLKKFKESELKFRTLVEKSLVGVYISQHERFSYVNPRFAEIFGYEPHELINTKESPIEIIFNEEDRNLVRNKVHARYSGEVEIDNYEVNGRKKDGSINRVQFFGTGVKIDGVPTIIGTMLDITERTKSQEVLKLSEANLKTILETADTAYVLMDKTLNLIAFNKMAVKFINSEFRIFPGKNDQFFDYLPKDTFHQFLSMELATHQNERLKQFVQNTREVLSGKNISYEVSYPQPNGLVFWYYIRMFPILTDKNEIFGLMMELSNITEQKNAEENLKAAYNKVQEHFESIQQMAWKQSHLIRGPLANLKGLAIILNDNPSDQESLYYLSTELEKLDKVLLDMEAEVQTISNSV